MKRLTMISVSLVVLLLLALSFQATAFAAPLKVSLMGQQIKTVIPNCPVPIKSTGSVTPQCVPTPPCTRTDCFKIDPYTSGCGTSTTYNQVKIKSAPIYQYYGGSGSLWGYVYNYYSSWCIANWNLVSLSVGAPVQLTIAATDSKGRFEEMCFPNNSCGTTGEYWGGVFPAWTNMIDGTNVTDACAWVSSNGGGLECVNQ